MIFIKSSMQLFTKSLNFAAIKHQSQRRKQEGDVPYINHPIEVSYILSRAGVKDYDVLIAGILHDTVEDTQTTPEELQEHFGKKIKDIVIECSDDKNLDKAARKRKQIEKAKFASNQAKLVKLADKISNNGGLLINVPKGWSQERVKGYFLWSEAVCSNLKGVNENLDKQIDTILIKGGIGGISPEDKTILLQNYYKTLLKATDK